jgi:hypothetical protein
LKSLNVKPTMWRFGNVVLAVQLGKLAESLCGVAAVGAVGSRAAVDGVTAVAVGAGSFTCNIAG